MKTRVLCLLLAVALMLGLTACGAKAPAASASPAASAAQGEPKTLTIGLSARSNVTDYYDNYFTKFMEDLLNIHIEFVFFSSDTTERKSQLATMVASGEKLPDILFNFSLSAEEEYTYGQDGYLMDLAPYFDDPDWELDKEYGWHENMLKWTGEATTQRALYDRRDPNGALYHWPASCASFTDQPNALMYINQKWLDNLGLEMPHTYDELVNVLRAFKTQDPNGNGKPDEIPMLGWASNSYGKIPEWVICSCGVYVNDTYLFNVDDNGKITFPYTTDEYRQGLRLVRDLVQEGLLSTMTWTLSSKEEMVSMWTPSSGEAVVGVVAAHPTIHMNRDSELCYEYVSLPALPTGCVSIKPLSVSNSYYITTDCQDFETAARFLMSFVDLNVARTSRRGEEGVDWIEIIDYVHQSPMVKTINDAYGGQTNKTWGTVGPYVGNYNEGSPWVGGDPEPPSEERTILEYTSDLLGEEALIALAQAEIGNPKTMFIGAAYNQQELDENGNGIEEIKTYVKDTRARFANGQMDVDNDAVWEQYVQAFQTMNLDTIMKNTQTAYDRMKK